MLITDSITYNLRERGRKHRGVDRNLDTAAVAAIINSNAVQEQVKHGDMYGYFGHWPRMKFGMAVQEGAIVDGKAVLLPISHRTVELHAEKDGTITHRTEFLDTEAGKVAEGLFKCKAGGFSSAIEPVKGTMPIVPRAFYGFDYVYEPNYSTNRGHKVLLDAVGADVTALLDGLLEQAAREQDEMAAIFDSLHAQHLGALETLERVSRENDELIDRLARATGRDRQALLDSIMEDVRMAPNRVMSADIDQWTKYRDVPLAKVAELPTPRGPRTSEDEYAARRYGFNG